MFFFDPAYLIYMIPAFILMAITSWYVKAAYNKWSRVAAGSRFNGYEATRRLVTAILQLLYYVSLVSGRSRD